MSNKEKPEVGSITWFDLTVPDAEKLKDFYGKVVGWKAAPVSMGDYNDLQYELTRKRKNKRRHLSQKGGQRSHPIELDDLHYRKKCG